jgi:hypothetical protein
LFHIHFTTSGRCHAPALYLIKLPTYSPNTNMGPIAKRVPSASEEQLQGPPTPMALDEEVLNDQRVQRILELPSERDRVWIIDDQSKMKSLRG